MELKPLAEWNLEYVRALPPGEYDWLEFKSSAESSFDQGHLDKLSDVLSAYANYDGGYLIFGIRDPKNQKIEFDDGLDLKTKNGLKAWLEDKLPMQTDPPLPKIEVHTIPTVKGGGRGIVIVRVPPSVEAPHQNRGGRYMSKRGSKLAVLGTRAVLDIVHRRRDPILEVMAHIHLTQPDIRNESYLLLIVNNVGKVLCKHVGLRIEVPNYIMSLPLVAKVEGNQKYSQEFHSVASINNGINSPSFPKSTLRFKLPLQILQKITDMNGQKKLPQKGAELIITLFADSAEPREFRFIADAITKIHPFRHQS